MLDLEQFSKDGIFVLTFDAKKILPILLDTQLAYYLFGTNDFMEIKAIMLKIKDSTQFKDWPLNGGNENQHHRNQSG